MSWLNEPSEMEKEEQHGHTALSSQLARVLGLTAGTGQQSGEGLSAPVLTSKCQLSTHSI